MVELYSENFENREQIEGANLILKACKAPFRAIMENAGLNSEVIWNNIYESRPDIETEAASKNYGYDARNEKYVNMVTVGIIDPLKVTRVALEKAVSVAGTMLTTECIVTKQKGDKDVMPQMPGMM